VPLDLEALGADFYAGNCHKWLCAPKGAGFLHVRPEHQAHVDGAIVGWGHRKPSTFISRTQDQGTRDAAAYLTVPAAIAFQEEHAWHEVRARCVQSCREARRDLCAVLGTEPIAPEEMVLQMASVSVPDGVGEALERMLWEEQRIEIPLMRPQKDLLRISVAAYTTRDDVERLLDALR
jgi:isopenicillin-N epimerase